MHDLVTIDGIKYAPISREGEQRHIVIVDNRGLTMVGMVDFSTNDYPKTIRGAQCIIRWGTAHHLAELAISGPLDNTLLGSIFDFTIHQPPIGSYICTEKWDE